jgi:hypothetical protein
MRTTIDIEADVLQAAKELAAVHKKTLGEMVTELIRKGLERPASPARVRNGIPLFPHRPGAPPITMAMVNALRDDE